MKERAKNPPPPRSTKFFLKNDIEGKCPKITKYLLEYRRPDTEDKKNEGKFYRCLPEKLQDFPAAFHNALHAYLDTIVKLNFLIYPAPEWYHEDTREEYQPKFSYWTFTKCGSLY